MGELRIIPLKLINIETLKGVVLPNEMLARMGVESGDTLFAIETAQGYLIRPVDPAIEVELQLGREFMNENRNTFIELAK